MTTKPNLFCALSLGLTLVLPGLSSRLQAQDDLFYLPDMEAEIFDIKKLDFGRNEEIDKPALANALTRIASDFDEEKGEVKNELRSNALGIAGRVNPDSKLFKTAYTQLEGNAEAWGTDATTKERVVASIYSGVRKLQAADKKKSNEANKICAAYCVDVALRLVPDHKDAKLLEKIREELKNQGVEINWDQLKGKAVVKQQPWNPFQQGKLEARKESMPAGPAPKLAANQKSIVGLVVVTLGGGKHAGAASEIIATALKQQGVKGVNFKIDQPVGDQMGNSLKSIRDYLRVTYEPKDMVPDGYEVSIVFQDRDQAVDGPSAGTAMALMLDALFSGDELDDQFACTGGVTPNGKCTKIGGVAAKIRGATRRKCKIAGVPEGNVPGVADILVLDGVQQLLDIQVFTMKDMDEARKLSRAKKEETVQSTLDDFKAVADVIAKDGLDMLKNAKVQEKLEAVLKKMPNHISAQLLLDYARGKAPKELSVGGSFHEIDTRASGVFSRVQMMILRDKFHEGKAAREDAKEALAELKQIEDKVDDRFKDYLEGAIGICESVEGGISDGEAEFLKQLKAKWDKVQAERKKLSEDPEIREEIMG